MDHLLFVEISDYFSDQYAHAGVDSPYIANNQPDMNVSLCTNDPDGSYGSSYPGSSGSSYSGTADGDHDHSRCFCHHEYTADMAASEAQNYKCCICGSDHTDSACVDCDCQFCERCIVDTSYHSVMPNNETLDDSSDSGKAPSGSDNGKDSSPSDSGKDSSASDSGEADSGSDEESNNGNNGNNN